MKSQTFMSVDGLELIVSHRKSAVIFEMNKTQLGKKYITEFNFQPTIFIELYNYLEFISKESWSTMQPKEAISLGADYYEYYDKELDNNGYLRIQDNKVVIDRPVLDNNKLYQFNKPKMESFLYDIKKMISNKQLVK